MFRITIERLRHWVLMHGTTVEIVSRGRTWQISSHRALRGDTWERYFHERSHPTRRRVGKRGQEYIDKLLAEQTGWYVRVYVHNWSDGRFYTPIQLGWLLEFDHSGIDPAPSWAMGLDF